MEYIAITIIAIAVTIFIVYKIANGFFGLGLKLKPLLLCALCALFISIVLPRIVVGFAGLAGTIGFLAVFAVIFAYFVAYYDEAQDPQISSVATTAAASLPEPVLIEPHTPLAATSQTPRTEETSAPVADVMVSPLPVTAEQEELSPMPIFPTQKEEEHFPDTLDELLEIAFTFKEELNFSAALKYFKEALKRFPASEAAPFLVVEIANILKNKGAYDDAIKIFTDGRNLPGLQSGSTLTKEFTETIAYLRIIRNTLLERRLGFIPFHNIPSDVCRDIDAEFREWRNLA